MAHDHHHHHHHHHRAPDAPEEPLDAASQSLSDALRASFGILKAIMAILVVLYFFSNVSGIQVQEEVLVLRMGKLQPKVRDAGLSWAFPYPIDEIVRLPTKGSNELVIGSHTFARLPNEVGKQLSFLTPRSSGLNPSNDGALLTADAGLVHLEWEITYKIDDVINYVTHLKGKDLEAARDLIKTMVATTGIEIASEMTADELTRTRIEDAQSEMRRRVNLRLANLNAGVKVENVNIKDPTPPLAVRASFVKTQQAENAKETQIREARLAQTKRLNEAVGEVYPNLLAALDADAVESTEATRAEVGKWLDQSEGRVGEMIREAESYFSVVSTRMQSELATYQTLIPEFERNPDMLVERLWEETRLEILNNPEVTKIYRPKNLEEFRVLITLDPEETQLAEQRAAEKDKGFDMEKIRPTKYHIIGPEFD
ncbi:MAG: SPFH domain-containing protein [Planctomycetota bacterium]|jgi:regulator of protease activity HflC (stomatin/prohibitin superfamily)